MHFDKLGPYLIGEKIGKGGMGAVFQAVEEQSGERVAVKALAPQLAMSEGFRERFEAEVESLKKLQHPGIVRLYGYGEEAGVLFYSMELVEGSSLDEEIKRGRRFDWRETTAIAAQVCRALKHAHDHGVVHRDIKPANLLMTADGVVKLADFGIARLFGSSQLTMAGGVLGTADYMSPEQAMGGPISERCDQYSLGGVMYALLTGRPPFQAGTMGEMLQLQRFADPDPVRRFAPDTPEQLGKVITQLLQKDPSKRFPNALVLGRHLEAMERALSRPEQEPEEIGLADEGLSLTQAETKLASPTNQTNATAGQGVDPANLHDAPTQVEQKQPGDQTARSARTLQGGDPSEEAPAGTSFTTVEGERPSSAGAGGEHWSMAVQSVAIGAVLLALLLGGWRLLRPATADELYNQIQQTVQENNGQVRLAGPLLDTFAERFPGDPRMGELKPYFDELELERVQRRLKVKSQLAGSEGVSPIGRLYSNAVEDSEHSPSQALGTLQSLVELYGTGGGDALSEEDQKWIELAKRQIQSLQEELREEARQHLPSVKERMSSARLLEEGDPARARRVYRAVVKLYSGKVWARDVVDQARRRLLVLDESGNAAK